jgi:FkbM family methyltransferase
MADLIYSAVGCFTSVRDPYVSDRFVTEMFQQEGRAEDARARFAAFLATRPLLPLLLEEIARFRGDDDPVPVVDCGVFMGNFCIAAALQADRLGLDLAITAYEANPVLVGPIRDNLALYDVQAKVRGAGIGGAYGTLSFVHAAAGLIGGTLLMPDSQKANGDHVTVDCEVIPLAEVLVPDLGPGLVKIDIEGNEVAAFGSVIGDAGRLNNVFIVEYAPWQGKLMLGGESYNDVLLRHFDVFDVNNWLWVPSLRPLRDAAALEHCMEAHKNRAHNTDLVLVPKAMTALSARLLAMATA